MASPAVVGTRPPRARAPTYSRDSNALRASVLNVALELGVGTSRAVENLIFDSFPEEDEENELVTTPPLTSASVATSDESWRSVPPWGGIPGQFVMPVRKPSNATAALNPGMEAVGSPSEDSHMSTVPLPHQPRKLRKARKDAYESDAGNLNDDVKRKKGSKKGSSSTFEGEFPSNGGYLSDATKKGADKKKKEKKKAAAEPSTQTSNKSTKKTRTSSEDGDLSDRGYQSEASTKKKKTFFRLRSRSPSVPRKGTPGDGSGPPPVPALPTTPLPVSPHFIRTPTPFSWLDGITLRAAHSPVPSSLDGRSVLASSIPSKDSPPPPSETTDRTATRSLSIDTTSESLTPSTTSHEIGPHGLSPAIPGKQTPMSAPAAVLPHDLRFTSSKRFGSSDALFPISQPSPVVAMTSGKLSPRPKTSPSATSHPSKASPSSIQPSIVPPISRSASPMFPPSDIQPFISRTLRPSPSPLQLTASPPLRALSPSLSQSSIIPSSDYILPSPRPRFYEDLPPPSPPPSCPLPELPSSSPYQPAVPVIQRGRQSPFPVRGALPVQDSSSVYPTKRIPQEFSRVQFAGVQAETREEDMVTTTANTVGNRVHGDPQDDVLLGLVEGVTVIPSSHNQMQEDDTEWPDDESVRPYMAQFYPYGLPSRSFGVGEILPRPWPDLPDDERHSTSTFQQLATSSTTNIRASAMPSSPAETDIYSYYFEEPDQDQGRDGGDSERRSHAGSVDDDHRREMRTRLPGIGYADALYGTEKIPPVPKIRPF